MQIMEVNGCYYLQFSSWGNTDLWYNAYEGSLEYCLKKMHKNMKKYLYNHPELIEGKKIC
jgi:hypothetical protein